MWLEAQDKVLVSNYTLYITNELKKVQSKIKKPQDQLSTDIDTSNKSNTSRDLEQYSNLANLMMLKVKIYNKILSQGQNSTSKAQELEEPKSEYKTIDKLLDNEGSNLSLSISIANYADSPMISHVKRLTKIWHRKQQYFFSYFFRVYLNSNYFNMQP